MGIGLVIFGITLFLVINLYNDGKYIAIIRTWKKYFQIGGIILIAFGIYIFIKKRPRESHDILSQANSLLRYVPLDKDSSDVLSPLLELGSKALYRKNQSYNEGDASSLAAQSIQHKSQVGGMRFNSDEPGAVGSGKTHTGATKRSVSETKKKFVAARQSWKCKHCRNMLPAWYEVDHVIRLQNGGSNHVDNLVALCRDCHGKKTAMETF